MRTIPHREQLPFSDFSDQSLGRESGGAAARPSVLAAVRSARSVSLHGNARYRLDVLKDAAALDARLRRTNDSAPLAMVVELHPDGPGPVGPLVRTLTRHFPRVPLIVACTEKAPDGREVLGAARAGAELFAFPPDDNLAALVARLVGDSAADANGFLPPLPRLASRMLTILSTSEPGPPYTVFTLADPGQRLADPWQPTHLGPAAARRPLGRRSAHPWRAVDQWSARRCSGVQV